MYGQRCGKPTQQKSTGGVHFVIATITEPAVAIPLASVIVLGLASLLRRLRLELLVSKPGPIFVRELTVAPEVSDVDIAHLTTVFRARLMQVRLHAPAPVPGATPAQDFLAVLDAEHLDAKNLLGSAVSVLRAAIPTHAYEVSVTLTAEAAVAPEKPRLGVTAQVTRLPNEGVPIETAWAFSWEDAITQAADMVTAAVLPRTVLSNRPPWSGWRRYPMPSLLVHHYEKAQELTSLRRYDEALAHCFLALELDPKSVDLRLCKGFIEEKLGLYLDAVATYAAAQRTAEQTSKVLYNRPAQRNRTASGDIARYRLAVLLGGINFAHQWRKPDTKTLRDRQRLFLRARLMPELQRLLEQHKVMPPPADNTSAKRSRFRLHLVKRRYSARRDDLLQLLDECGTGAVADENDRRYYELRDVLGELARQELRDVRHNVRWRRTQRGSLTPLSVNLTVACLDLRLRYVSARLKTLKASEAWTTLKPSTAWIPDPEAALAPSPRPFRTWTEEYTAACLYGLPLLVNEPLTADSRDDEGRRHALAQQAVHHLENAMSSTVSWEAAQRRDWVLSEDPDLDGLRQCPQFKHFETIYFPSPAPTPRRPRRAVRWEQSRYTNRLLAETAIRWEKVWHARRKLVVSGVDPHVVIQWSKDETDAWRLVDCLAHDYRHWPVRRDLIEQMKVWSATYGFEPLGVGVPSFARENGQDANAVDRDVLCEVVKEEVHRNEGRLQELVKHLVAVTGAQYQDAGQPIATDQQSRDDRIVHQGNGEPDGLQAQPWIHQRWTRVASALRFQTPTASQLEQLQDELRNRDFWHRAAPKLYLPAVCDVHAAMWQRLHEWLEEPRDHATLAWEFECAVAQAARLSGTSRGVWFLALIDRRVRRLASGGHGTGASARNGTSDGAREGAKAET